MKKGRLVIYAAIVLVVGLFYLYSDHGYFTLRKLNNYADSLEVVRDSLKAVLDETNSRIEKLKKEDNAAIEYEARKLGMADPEEKVIIVNIDSTGEECNGAAPKK